VGSAPATSQTGAASSPSTNGSITDEYPGGAAAAAAATAKVPNTSPGVTPTTIKLGFSPINFAAIVNAGIPITWRTDQDQTINAFVKYINAHGGVAGRQIVADIHEVNLLNPDDAQSKCIQFTQTDKVFAIIDVSSYSSDPQCPTVQNHTILYTLYPGDQQQYDQTFPYLLSSSANYNQAAADWVYGGQQEGFFNGGGKVGITELACDASEFNDPNNGVLHYLKLIGFSNYITYSVPCSITAEEGAAQSILLKFRQAGVKKIMEGAGTGVAVNLTTQAQRQGYHPQWLLSDIGNGVINANDLNKYEINGAYGVTSLNVGGFANSPGAQMCNTMLTSAGLKGVTQFYTDGSMLWLCSYLLDFVQVANLAGQNLTEQSFVQAAQRSGAWKYPADEVSDIFGSGKLDGSDTIQLVRFDDNCPGQTGGVCWKPSAAAVTAPHDKSYTPS
jgi:hypothetical protein